MAPDRRPRAIQCPSMSDLYLVQDFSILLRQSMHIAEMLSNNTI